MSFDPLPEIHYSKDDNCIRLSCAGLIFTITFCFVTAFLGLVLQSFVGLLPYKLQNELHLHAVEIVLAVILSIVVAAYLAKDTFHKSNDFVDYLNGR